jgi:hypothetical protein
MMKSSILLLGVLGLFGCQDCEEWSRDPHRPGYPLVGTPLASDWQAETLPLPPRMLPLAIDIMRGSGPDNVWLTAEINSQRTTARVMLRYDSKSWQWVRDMPIKCVINVWPVSPTDVWAVGYQGCAAHFDGKTWTQHDVPDVEYDLNDVWASPTGEAIVSSGNKPLFRFDGSSWSTIPDPPEFTNSSVHGPWGTAAEPMWVVGILGFSDDKTGRPGQDRIGRHDQSGWHFDSLEHLDRNGLVLFGGSSPRDIWALSFQNASFHFDGHTWQVHKTIDSGMLSGMTGVSPTEAYAVGEPGLVLRWDGIAWKPLRTGTNQLFMSVYAAPGLLFVGGDKVYRRLVR